MSNCRFQMKTLLEIVFAVSRELTGERFFENFFPIAFASRQRLEILSEASKIFTELILELFEALHKENLSSGRKLNPKKKSQSGKTLIYEYLYVVFRALEDQHQNRGYFFVDIS